MHATILAIPAQRQDPPDEPEVRFMEAAAIRAARDPHVVVPGPHDRPRVHLSEGPGAPAGRAQTETVLTVETDATEPKTCRSADLSRIDAAGKETRREHRHGRRQARSPPAAPAPERMPAPTPTRSGRRPHASTSRAPSCRARRRPLPLVGLIGLASLAGAALLRRR